ncbi:T9SS type A sorting domain-containing protein [bacterium]|nr:T9SS type A sorting domain-containing protein [bacterium]
MYKLVACIFCLVIMLNLCEAQDAFELYIADEMNHRIVRIDDMYGTGWTSFGHYGSGVGEIRNPTGIAIGLYGRIYISDFNNNRLISIKDMSGAGWLELHGFNRPHGNAVGPDGKIYIADSHNHRIVRIDDMSGDGWVSYGSFGAGVGEFHYPVDVVISHEGQIYIADDNNHRIVRIDNMEGDGWISFGSYGHGVGNFCEPRGIALGPDEKIYVSDDDNNRIVKVDDMYGTGWQTFDGVSEPWDVAVDPDGRIFMTETYYNRVIKIDDMSGSGIQHYGRPGSGIGEFYYTIVVMVDPRYTGISKDHDVLKPGGLSITAYPNPFNSQVNINYVLSADSRVTLKIHDILGNTVSVLVDELQDRGEHFVTWRSEGLSSGIYSARLCTNNENKSISLLFIK